MPEHVNNVNLHRAVVRALAVLAQGNEVSRGSIAKEDGIYLILIAMESFTTDEELQKYACEAPCALVTEHATNCSTIFDQGGLRIVSKVMKDHFMHEVLLAVSFNAFILCYNLALHWIKVIQECCHCETRHPRWRHRQCLSQLEQFHCSI